MKAIIQISMQLCFVFLIQKGNGQAIFNSPEDSMIADNINKQESLINNDSPGDLEYNNLILTMESKLSGEAYNDLLQRFEKLKAQLLQYQKLIHEYTLMPSTEFFSCTNVHNSNVLCGESFLEEAIPNSVSENSVITYFVAKGFAHAIISFSNNSGVDVANYIINESGYGQCVINAGELKTGTYNYCLVVDGRVLDCKKMIVMK